MTTDPEPLSAEDEAMLRALAFDAEQRRLWFTPSEMRAVLATLDEARATPSGLAAAAQAVVDEYDDMGDDRDTFNFAVVDDLRAALRSAEAKA